MRLSRVRRYMLQRFVEPRFLGLPLFYLAVPGVAGQGFGAFGPQQWQGYAVLFFFFCWCYLLAVRIVDDVADRHIDAVLKPERSLIKTNEVHWYYGLWFLSWGLSLFFCYLLFDLLTVFVYGLWSLAHLVGYFFLSTAKDHYLATHSSWSVVCFKYYSVLPYAVLCLVCGAGGLSFVAVLLAFLLVDQLDDSELLRAKYSSSIAALFCFSLGAILAWQISSLVPAVLLCIVGLQCFRKPQVAGIGYMGILVTFFTYLTAALL